MGIIVGSKNGPMAEMNVVPLIDVLLVLLIIFMVITPMVPTGLRAEVPQPGPPDNAPPSREVVIVWIAPGGQLRINQEKTDWGHLGPRLEEIFKTRAQKVAFVWSDPQIRFEEVARVIDTMRGAGVNHVGLLPADFKKN